MRYGYNSIIKLLYNKWSEQKDKTAVVCSDKEYTYEDLILLVQEQYKKLITFTKNPHHTVAIECDRTIYTLATLFACIKCRRPFLLLDKGSEKQKEYAMRLGNPYLLYSECSFHLNNEFQACEPLKDIAYIIFTSGSLGNPKGICISASSFFHAIKTLPESLEFQKEESVLSISNVQFDIFLLETVVALCNGMTVFLLDDNDIKNTRNIKQQLEITKASIIQMVPSKLLMFMHDDPELRSFRFVRKIILGGEMLQPYMVNAIKSNTTAALYHLYGLTEDTIWTTVQKIEDEKDIHIGQCINGHILMVLNENKQPAKFGEEGILYIGGRCLLAKSINDTRQYIDYKLNNRSIRLINSGDKVYLDHTGKIRLLGRIDYIKKVSGHLINLIEIEDMASQISGVFPIIAQLFKNKADKNVLCLYFVSCEDIDLNSIKKKVEAALPKFLWPCHCFLVQQIEYLPSGKINRNSAFYYEKFKERRI